MDLIILRNKILSFLPAEMYARLIGVKIGKNCAIHTKNWSTEPYLVTIGNNVAITHGVFIHTHGGGRTIRRMIPDFDSFGKVVIEDWAYIGSGAHIMPGVTIGEGSLVAAGSVVTKNIPKIRDMTISRFPMTQNWMILSIKSSMTIQSVRVVQS